MSSLIDAGTVTLSSGTATVSNANVQTGDNIMLSIANLNFGQNSGAPTYVAPPGSIVNGTSFTINSTKLNGSLYGFDTSDIYWVIVRP